MKILLVDDHQVFRESLCSCLVSRSDFQIVGEAGNGQQAIEMAERLSPDLVIMDIAMPVMNGIEATRQFRKGGQSHPKVLILSTYKDVEFVVESLKAGAAGYILKISAFEELLNAIDAVMMGRTYLGAGVPEIGTTTYSS